MTNPPKHIFILSTSSPFGGRFVIILSLILVTRLSFTLQTNLNQNQIEKLTAKCQASESNEILRPLFYSFEINECQVTCFMLTTTTPNYDDLYYDKTVTEIHDIDEGENCRGYLSKCQNGQCEVSKGRLEIIIFSAKHQMIENKLYDNSIGDPYVRILIGERMEKSTEWVNDSFEPIYNSSITYIFENVKADEQITLILKDKNEFVDSQIDKFRTSAGEIAKNNFSGVKRFYPFDGETKFGITALITFVVN